MNLKQVISELHKSLTDSIRALKHIANSEKILKQAYEGRFLFELIQNARDANKEANNKNGKIKIILKNNELSVLNTGAPFSEKGIKSISTIGDSPKGKNDYIGHKGIGFKSVLEISENPSIITEFGTIYFDRKQTNDLLKVKEKKISVSETPLFFFPHYNNQTIKAKEYTTEIKLPLKNDKNIIHIIEKAFEEIEIEQIVLLGNLEEIIFDYNGKTERYKITSLNKSNSIQVDKYLNDEIISTAYFKSYEKIVTLDEKTYNLLSKEEKDEYKINDELEIKILIRINNNNRFDRIDNAQLYLYYPLEIQSGFPFLIHSNFIVNPERKRLSNSPLNDFLLKEIGSFISNGLFDKIKNSFKTKLLSIIQFNKDDDKLELLYSSVINGLTNKKFIFDKITNRFYFLDRIIISDKKHNNIFENNTFLGKPIVFLIKEQIEWLETYFEVNILNDALLLSQIENECKKHRKHRNYKFFIDLYTYFSKENINITNQKVFLTTSNKLVSKEETIFYGGKNETLKGLPKQVNNRIYFIHSKIELKNFRENYSDIGIKEFSLREFVRRLLSLYDESNRYNWDILNTLLKINYNENQSLINEIKNNVKLPIQNKREWIKTDNVIYFDDENLKNLYPNAFFVNEEKIRTKLGVENFDNFLLYCGVWNIPAIILKTTYLDYNDGRNWEFRKISGLNSYPFTIYNDRVIDEPKEINDYFSKILLKNIEQYTNYIDNIEPKLQYRSAQAYDKRTIYDNVIKYSSFTNWLKDNRFIKIENEFYKPNEIFGISPLDYSKNHFKILKDFLPLLPIDYQKHSKFIDAIGILHFDNLKIENYNKILDNIYLKFENDIPSRFEMFYNRILSKLSDLYDFDLQNDLNFDWEILEDTYFLSINKLNSNSLEWKKANEIFHIDNLSSLEQLPFHIKEKLQPTFTNRDKNTFGRIASRIGNVSSKSINIKLLETQSIIIKKAENICNYLAELITLLEYLIERSIKENEIDKIKNALIIFQEIVKVKYSIQGIDADEITNVSHFSISNKVYLTDKSLTENKNKILLDLFSNILNRDLSKYRIQINQFIFTDDKKAFLIENDIPTERVDEIKSLINDFVLSNEDHFWWTILNLKENIDFNENILEDNFVNLINKQYNLSDESINEIIEISKQINFDEIENEINIIPIYNIFNKLEISLKEFNNQSLNKISFDYIHTQKIRKLFNKNQNTLKGIIYNTIKANKDISLMEKFQSIIDEYDYLEKTFELKEDLLKVEYEDYFIELINEQFNRIYTFTKKDLKSQEKVNLSQIFKNNLDKLKEHFNTDIINDNRIIENPRLRSLLYFDYKLLIEEYSDSIINSQNVVSSQDEEIEILNISSIKVDTKPKHNNSEHKEKTSNRKGKRANGNKYSKEKQKIGLIAEKEVFKYLKNKNIKNVKWVSKNATLDKDFIGFNPEGSDDLGYDIEYLDDNDNKILVEVKGRSGREFTFHLTSKEKNVALANKENFIVIFVSGIKTETPIIYDLGFIFNFNETENFYDNSKFSIIENDYIIEFEIKN
jgi:hypothetical protein